MTASGKIYDMTHEKQFDHADKMHPTALSIFLKTLMDVLIFLGASIGFIVQAIYYRITGHPETSLNGDLALVTGGGGGLGRLLSLRLAKLGVDVVIWDINQEGIDETVRQVKSIGGRCNGYVVDISKKEEVYAAAEIIRQEIGNVTILINNAGVVSGRALLDTPDHLIERSFNVNVLAHFWTTKAFLPAMLEKDHGHIVTIASLAGHVGIAKLVDYCSSKFAAVGFDEALRLELESIGSRGVTTTCICPFFIQATGMFDDVNSRWVPTLTSEDVADRIISSMLRREKNRYHSQLPTVHACNEMDLPMGLYGRFPSTNRTRRSSQARSYKRPATNTKGNRNGNGEIGEQQQQRHRITGQTITIDWRTCSVIASDADVEEETNFH